MSEPESETTLPEHVEEVRVLRIQPGDVVVASVPEPPSQDVVDHLTDQLKELWPNNEVAVLCGGIELSVGREG